MLFKSQVYSQASGSIGGVTYSRNKGGMYTRSRAIPTNPNSFRQQARRSALAALVNRWQDWLTENQRASWNDYAQQVTVTNRLGDQIQLSGQQQYVRSNTVSLLTSGATIDDAPTVFDTGAPPTYMGPTSATPGQPPVFAIDSGSSALALRFAIEGQAPDDGTLVLQIGKPVSEALNYYKGPYQYSTQAEVTGGAVEVLVPTPFNLLQSDVEPAVNQRRGVRARILYVDGRLSLPYAAIATVTETV